MEYIRPLRKNKGMYLLQDEDFNVLDVVMVKPPLKCGAYGSKTSKEQAKTSKQRYEDEIAALLSAGYENSGHFVFEGVVDLNSGHSIITKSGTKINARLAKGNLWTILRSVTNGEMKVEGEMKIHGFWELSASRGDMFIKPSKLI